MTKTDCLCYNVISIRVGKTPTGADCHHNLPTFVTFICRWWSMSKKSSLREERTNFRSYEGKNKREKHIRLTNSMLTDERYKALSSDAKVLYNYMKLWAYGSPEYKKFETFDYSISRVMDIVGVSVKTAVKCVKELEKNGFIERVNNSKFTRETSKFKFSDKWWRTD